MDNLLTIDLEEWYHAEYVKRKASTNKEERVIKSFDKTFGLLSEFDVTATFFVVGELAEKYPEIVEKLGKSEHEIAFHGYYHEPLCELDAERFRLELKRFGSFVKRKCVGFRAPSFSLNNKTKWALKVLEDVGYEYDSSIFPTKTPLYGVWGAPRRPYKPSFEDVAKEDGKAKLWEFPLFVHQVAGIRIPFAGGFYLRFFPIGMVGRAIKKANENGFPAVLFFHCWELDSGTPKLNLGPYKSFITYYNLRETERKLISLLSDFEFTSVRNYLESF